MLNFVAIRKGINTTPSTSELRRQGRKRREVNVGNNRDVHQVSMHGGRTWQKLTRHGFLLLNTGYFHLSIVQKLMHDSQSPLE